MNTTAIMKTEMTRELAMIPEDKLNELQHFLKSLLSQTALEKRTASNLRGIWKHRGFEKLNIEAELHKARNELGVQILKRDI
ncbi:MAG: hypothetical protein HN351_06515 [Deltaproteobacteria bacterium]|jgi:hypothetical protein|nr:hypothetical protein [Deltaproteobacteria bacterium]